MKDKELIKAINENMPLLKHLIYLAKTINNGSNVIKNLQDLIETATLLSNNNIEYKGVKCSFVYLLEKCIEDDDTKWTCQLCGQLVEGKNVTFDEHHEGCGGHCI